MKQMVPTAIHRGVTTVACVAILAGACGRSGAVLEACTAPQGDPAPDSLRRIGCQGDFLALASVPLTTTIPGARSVKVVFDIFDGTLMDQLYFQNSVKFQIHYQFATKHLSAPDHFLVPSLSQFNQTEYYKPENQRRFILGAVTHYEGPDAWVVEVAPYDTATPKMIEKLFNKVKGAVFFKDKLYFHPTSEAVEARARELPASIKIKTTDEIFAGTDYQPLNLGTTIGTLRFPDATGLQTAYVGFRDVVVLDRAPNDISVVSGMITEQFQTPLSHVNVLAQNRGTPNMGLRKARTDARLRALDGKWVKLTVGASDWSIVEATQEEADAFWELHRPTPIQVPQLDLTETRLRDIADLVDESPGTGTLKQQIQKAIGAFGTKASNYSVLAKTKDVPTRPAFGIPVYYYVQFMEQNGFFAQVDALTADPDFANDPKLRDTKLAELRTAIEAAPVDAAFQDLLRAKLAASFPNETMRFRTSTNAEDLDGFPCAGCYDSHTGDPADWDASLLRAIKRTWAGVWSFRTFEERSYHGIDHSKVAMALLVHHNFPDEEANGVAVTANPYDAAGLEPGFYVNVQAGGAAEVVAPPPGVTSDQFIYFFYFVDRPTTYLGHSNLVPQGQTVLTPVQIFELGTSLDAIHERFSPAYGPKGGFTGWYGMDVEFKFDDEEAPGVPARLFVKQARPFHGRGE
ncbi:MAG: PEP/pyruvate-binding domain-containing protein [Pseudomonadota bacterium]